MPESEDAPELDYPVAYVFRVVLPRAPDVRARVHRLVESELGPLPEEATTVRESRAGRYVAVHVSCVLQSEEERRAVYQRLRELPQVLLTL